MTKCNNLEETVKIIGSSLLPLVRPNDVKEALDFLQSILNDALLRNAKKMTRLYAYYNNMEDNTELRLLSKDNVDWDAPVVLEISTDGIIYAVQFYF